MAICTKPAFDSTTRLGKKKLGNRQHMPLGFSPEACPDCEQELPISFLSRALDKNGIGHRPSGTTPSLTARSEIHPLSCNTVSREYLRGGLAQLSLTSEGVWHKCREIPPYTRAYLSFGEGSYESPASQDISMHPR